MTSANNTKKWLTLGLVGMALLLIPRRSSKRAEQPLSKKSNHTENTKNTADD